MQVALPICAPVLPVSDFACWLGAAQADEPREFDARAFLLRVVRVFQGG